MINCGCYIINSLSAPLEIPSNRTPFPLKDGPVKTGCTHFEYESMNNHDRQTIVKNVMLLYNNSKAFVKDEQEKEGVRGVEMVEMNR